MAARQAAARGWRCLRSARGPPLRFNEADSRAPVSAGLIKAGEQTDLNEENRKARGCCHGNRDS